VPHAIKLLNGDVHLSVPRRTRIPANTSLSRLPCDSLLGTLILITDFGTQLAPFVERMIAIVSRASESCELFVRSFGVAGSMKIARRRSIGRA
jgi:hypothetical protein